MNSCTTISGRGGLVRFVNLITKYEPRFRRFGRTCKSTRLAVRDRADSEAVFPACPGFCAVQQNKREYLWICGHSLQPTSAYFSLLQATSICANTRVVAEESRFDLRRSASDCLTACVSTCIADCKNLPALRPSAANCLNATLSLGPRAWSRRLSQRPDASSGRPGGRRT